MSEERPTDRERVEGLIRGELEAILAEILAEDKLPPGPGVARFRFALLAEAFAKRLSDEGIALLAALSDEDLRRGARDHFEPAIRAAIGPLRPS